MSPVVVRDVRPGDEAGAIRVLVRAFVEFPAMQVVVGTDAGAAERLARLFAMEFEPGSRTAAIVAERAGALVGVVTYADRPDCSATSLGRTLRLLRIAGPRVLPTLRMFSRIERLHPSAPHRHLPSIGIDPAVQGQGIGGLLMAEYDRRCDQAGLEGYLETIRWADGRRPSHRRFYERAGFRVADELPMGPDWSIMTMRRPVAAT